MRTDDLLALCNHPRAGHWGSFERRSALIGAILAALVIGGALINAYAPTAEAFVAKLGVSKNLDRGSSLPSLPVLD
jgi:hypothetical protein